MRSRAPRGFTLIEILVVVIILGLLATVAVFSLGDSAGTRELENKSRELYLFLQIAEERALLDNSEIGVQVVDNELSFLRYDPEELQWERINQRPFRSRQWPDQLFLEVETGQDPPRMPTTEEERDRPDLVFFSSGETTPFRLVMGLNTDPDHSYRLETDGLNPMTLLEPNEDNEVRLQ